MNLLSMLSLGILALAQNPTGQTPTPVTPAPAHAGGYSLNYKPTEGTVTTYQMLATMDIQGGTGQMDAKVVQKVIKVDPDGTYSLQSDTVEGKVTVLGQELPMPKNSAVTIYKSNGEVVSVSGDQVNQSVMRTENLTMFKRPDHPVNPGDTWTLTIKSDPATKSPSVQGTYTFDGEETVGKFQALKVESKVSEGDTLNPGSVTATFWVNKDDGSLIKYDCQYRDMTFPGSSSPLSGKLGMARVDI